MQRPILIAIIVAAVGLWDLASCEGSPPESPPRPLCPATATGCCPGAPPPACPDDYCHKRGPRICKPPCGLPDDYCPKPAPRICRPAQCNLPDDYSRKPCPNLCRPISSEHYTCGGPPPGHPVLPSPAPVK